MLVSMHDSLDNHFSEGESMNASWLKVCMAGVAVLGIAARRRRTRAPSPPGR